MDLQREIRKLASSSCANFADKDRCLIEPDGQLTCRYFRENAEEARCRYFESSVLPADTALEARYYGGSKRNVIRCAMCHKEYVRTSNRQRYCIGCRERAETEARRRRDARYKSNKATV
ncbi:MULTISPECIES: cysteine-rich VLP protein [unclassified Paenibacillus]|uniref:cysteine-rich VLP protein n=1 Tax=unclassified Paenibacillus TaxID=185978 RepID=UPI0036274F35